MSGIAAAILAGGQATRMGGAPKSFLLVEGERVIDRQLAVLSALFTEIWIVANDPAPYLPFGLPIVGDETPGQGPLGGILAVLEAAQAEHVVVVGCDMPYLAIAPLARLAAADLAADLVVPFVDGMPEPLCARYARKCAVPIRARLAAGNRKTSDLIEDQALSVLRVGFEGRSRRFLVNVNAPEDLTRL